MRNLWNTFRQRNFALLWTGGFISMIGNWMLQVARPLFVYQLTGSTLLTGLMLIAGTVPRLLLGSVAGVFVDRWDRRRTLIIANVIQATLLLPLLLVHSVDTLWIFYLTTMIQSCVSVFTFPAENALLPTLVDESHRQPANTLNALNDNLARLTGPAFGGVIMATVGFSGVLLLDAATFIVAAIMIALIHVPETESAKPAPSIEDAERTGSIWRKVWNEWLDGLNTVRQSPSLRLLFINNAIISIGEGVFGVLLVPFATSVLNATDTEVGSLVSAQAIGGLIGGLVVGIIGARSSAWKLVGWGCIGLGLMDGLLINYHHFFAGFGLSLLFIALAGVPAMLLVTNYMTLLQNHTTDQYRGRVFGALTVVSGIFSLIGMGIASVGGDVIGIGTLINVQVIGYTVGGILILLRAHTVTNGAGIPDHPTESISAPVN